MRAAAPQYKHGGGSRSGRTQTGGAHSNCSFARTAARNTIFCSAKLSLCTAHCCSARADSVAPPRPARATRCTRQQHQTRRDAPATLRLAQSDHDDRHRPTDPTPPPSSPRAHTPSCRKSQPASPTTTNQPPTCHKSSGRKVVAFRAKPSTSSSGSAH